MGKAQNIFNRMQWLKLMLTDEMVTVDVEAACLKNAKAFCEFEIVGQFDPISYNTLKSYLQGSLNDEYGVHAYQDNFEYFLELRKQVYDDLVEVNHEPVDELGDGVDWKRMYRNALWQSNICATAYLSLRRELQAILETNRQDHKLDYRKLEKALKTTSATYFKIISQEPEPPVPDLKIIQGAKK